MARIFLVAGALLGGLAVAAGAFGAHALESMVSSERLETFGTAVQYQMYHALGLLVTGWLRMSWTTTSLEWAGMLFLVGIVLFSGSLYVLVLTDTPWLGAVTPFGGAAFILGWGALAWALCFELTG